MSNQGSGSSLAKVLTRSQSNQQVVTRPRGTTVTTAPPSQKSEEQWQKEYDTELNKAKEVLRDITKYTEMDKAKLGELKKLFDEALNHRKAQEPEYEKAIQKLQKFQTDGKQALKVVAKKEDRASRSDLMTFAQEAVVNDMSTVLPSESFLAIQALMNQHRNAVKTEIQVFGTYDDLQDVMEIKDESERATTLRKIGDAINAAKEREKQMLAEVRKLPPLPDKATEEQKKTYRDAFALVVTMCEHIPGPFLASWTPNFAARINTLCLSPEDKKKKLEELKKDGGFSDIEKTGHLAVFKAGIEPHSTKEFERVDFYFDSLISAPTGDDLKAIYEVQNELIAKAREIRDCGGTLADCEKVLEHIPRTWWPPEFVEELQAWRKTERALRKEAVRDMFEEKSELLETAKGCVEFVMGTLGQLASMRELGAGGVGLEQGVETNDINSWLNDDKIVAELANWGETVKGGWETGSGVVEALKSGDFTKTDMTAEQAAELATKITKSMNDVMKNVGSLCKQKGIAPPPDSFMATKFLPGLAIATAGIDLALSIKNLVIHSKRAFQTSIMENEALMLWASGKDEDGGAFVNTLKNEMRGRKTQMAKDSLDITTNTLALAGAIGEASGMGAHAGIAIKIVGKAIEVGGVIVFTNIEWGLANNAKKLIKEAQAGNPIARLQIFEECNLYAKMYIAILVKEGHPLAKKFLEQRGIEEGDLTNALSLKILREAMLSDVDQRDEREVADSLIQANIEGFTGGGIIKAGKALLEKMAQIPSLIKGTPPAYDPGWMWTGEIAIAKDKYDGVKTIAETKGLYHELTGIGRTLANVEKAETLVAKATPEKKQTCQMALLKALQVAETKIRGWTPLTNPQGEEKKVTEHKGMVLYLVALLKKMKERMDEVDLGPITDDTTDPPTRDSTQGVGLTEQLKSWTPTPNQPALASSRWKSIFQDMKQQCSYDGDDEGIENALKAVEKAIADTNYDDNATDKQKQREARLTAQTRYNDLLKLLNGFWTSCGMVENMRTYVTGMIGLVATDLRELDKKLYGSGVTWVSPAKGMAESAMFTALLWERTYESAEQAGVIIAGKGSPKNVTAALKEVTAAKQKLDDTTDAKAKVKARQDYKKVLTKVFAAANAFASGQGTMVKDLADYVKVLLNRSRELMLECEKEQNEVAFTVPTDKKNLTDTDFRAVYNAAVEAGAIEPGESTARKVEGALKKYVAGKDKYSTESSWKDKRKAALKTKADLGKVQQALSELSGLYGEHKSFGSYTRGLLDKANKPELTAELDKVLDGQATGQDFPANTEWKWEDATWQKAKKVAIDAGLIEDKATGLGGSLTKAKKAYDTAITGATNTEKYPGWKQEAITAIRLARSLAATLKGTTKNANFQNYFKKFIDEADTMVGQLP